MAALAGLTVRSNKSKLMRQQQEEQAQHKADLTPVVPGPGRPHGPDEALTCRQKVYLLIEEPDSSCGARVISYILLVTILASIVGFILQTEPSLMDSVLLEIVEIGSLIIFTVEYATRFVVCDAFGDQTRCAFVKAPGNVVDLLAIFPTYLLDMLQSQTGNSDATKPLRVLRAVRLVRVFRIFKLSRYSSGMGIMLESMVNSARPLFILMFILSIGIIFFSSLVYHAEAVSCPHYEDMISSAISSYHADCAVSSSGFSSDGYLCCNEFGSPNDFESIVAAFWWSMVTMTTVGYGDKAPKTFLGRTVGCVAMIAGIVLISLPVAIVGSKFQEAYEVMEENDRAQRASEQQQEEPSPSEAQSTEKSALGPVFQTVRFLERTQMLAEVSPTKSDELKPPEVSTTKSDELKPPEPAKPSDGAQSREAKKASSPYADQSLKDASVLREKLRKLEGRRQLSRAAQGQVELTLELLDHLEAVDKRLSRLHEKDAALDVCLHRDFVALSRVCSVQPSASASGIA